MRSVCQRTTRKFPKKSKCQVKWRFTGSLFGRNVEERDPEARSTAVSEGEATKLGCPQEFKTLST